MTESDTNQTPDMTSQLDQLKAELTERDKTLAQLRTRHALETQLRDAGTVDLDAAMALTERALLGKPDAAEADAQSAVADLQRMRPWLFRTRSVNSSSATGVQSPATDDASAKRVVRLKDAAADASVSGSRIDLLRYLRLRRKR